MTVLDVCEDFCEYPVRALDDMTCVDAAQLWCTLNLAQRSCRELLLTAHTAEDIGCEASVRLRKVSLFDCDILLPGASFGFRGKPRPPPPTPHLDRLMGTASAWWARAVGQLPSTVINTLPQSLQPPKAKASSTIQKV